LRKVISFSLLCLLLASPAVAVDYYAVCCDRVLVAVDHGKDYYCNDCRMFPIKSTETMDLPPNCQWYNMRQSAKRAYYNRDTCK
jgi:hypothetical protein